MPGLNGGTASSSLCTAGSSREPDDERPPHTTPPKEVSLPVTRHSKWEAERTLESPATVLSPVSHAGSNGIWTPSSSPGVSSEGSRRDLEEDLGFSESGSCQEAPTASPQGPAPHGGLEQGTGALRPRGGTVRDAPDTLLYCQDSMNLGSRVRDGEVGCSTARDTSTVYPDAGSAVQSEDVLLDIAEAGSRRETLMRLSSREMWAAGAGSAKFGNGAPAVLTAVEEVESCDSPDPHQRNGGQGTGYPLGTHTGSKTQEKPLSGDRVRLLEDGAEPSSCGAVASGQRNGMLEEGGGERRGLENGRAGVRGKAEDGDVSGGQGGSGRTGKIIVMEERNVGRVDRDMYLVCLCCSSLFGV